MLTFSHEYSHGVLCLVALLARLQVLDALSNLGNHFFKYWGLWGKDVQKMERHYLYPRGEGCYILKKSYYYVSPKVIDDPSVIIAS